MAARYEYYNHESSGLTGVPARTHVRAAEKPQQGLRQRLRRLFQSKGV